jgi:hypothetical protein
MPRRADEGVVPSGKAANGLSSFLWVQVIPPRVADAGVNLLDSGLRLLPVVAEFDLPGHHPLDSFFPPFISQADNQRRNMRSGNTSTASSRSRIPAIRARSLPGRPVKCHAFADRKTNRGAFRGAFIL